MTFTAPPNWSYAHWSRSWESKYGNLGKLWCSDRFMTWNKLGIFGLGWANLLLSFPNFLQPFSTHFRKLRHPLIYFYRALSSDNLILRMNPSSGKKSFLNGFVLLCIQICWFFVTTTKKTKSQSFDHKSSQRVIWNPSLQSKLGYLIQLGNLCLLC